MNLLELLFWTCFGVLFYAYFGYGLLLLIVQALKKRFGIAKIEYSSKLLGRWEYKGIPKANSINFSSGPWNSKPPSFGAVIFTLKIPLNPNTVHLNKKMWYPV